MGTPGSPRKNSWKARAATQRTKSAGARWIGRLVSTLLALGLLSLVVYLLVFEFPSWSTGKLKMLAVHLEDDDARQLWQAPFTRDDCRAFKDNDRLDPQVIGWSEAEFGRSLSKRIRDLRCQPNDVLLLYLTGIGLSHDRKAYIVCRESDLARDADSTADEEWLDVATLLKTIDKAAGKDVRKVLVLDVGRLGSDPRTGLVVNEFPVLLENEVRESGASDLWVLNSTALLQTSRVVYSKQRSVFGQAVAEGLDGRADTGRAEGQSGDGSVRLFELYDYVLQRCAAQSRGDDPLSLPGQTPLLMRGGAGVLSSKVLNKRDREDVNDPVLVRSAVTTKTEPKPPAKPAEDSAPRGKGEPAKAAGLRPAGSLSARVAGSRIASQLGFLALGAAQEAGGAKQPLSNNEDKPAAQPEKTGTSSSAAPAAEGKKAESPVGQQPAPPAMAVDPVPENAHPLLRGLATAWKLRDEIQTRKLGQRRSPIDFAPHLWRALDARLLTLERRYLTRHESEADARELEDTIRVLKELKAAIGEFRAAAKTLDDPLIEAWNQFAAAQLDRPQSAANEPVLALQQDFADLMWQAGYVVRWFDHASLTDSSRSADLDPPIKPFLEGLAGLGRQIDGLVQKSAKRPLPDKDYQPLIKQCGVLKEFDVRIRQAVSADRARALKPETAAPLAERLAEDLLRTPLCDAGDRLNLSLLLRPAGEARPEGGAAGAAAPQRWDASQIKQIKWWEGTAAQWRALRERSELHVTLAGLSVTTVSPVLPSAGKLADLPEKLNERLAAHAALGLELAHFGAAIPAQIADEKLEPFAAWRLAQRVSGRALADRRNSAARSAGFFWELRVLQNAGRIEFVAGAPFAVFEEDFMPLRIAARGWSGNLPSVDVSIDFDPLRVEVRSADGKVLKPHDPVTVPLAGATGEGEAALGIKWKGPKSLPKDSQNTKLSISVVAHEDLASAGAPNELLCELNGARPVELAIGRHGLAGAPMTPKLDASGGAANLKAIPGRPTGFDLSLINHLHDDVGVTVHLLAVPAASTGGRGKNGARTPSAGPELHALLFDEAGKPRPELILAVAAAEGKPVVPLKTGRSATSLVFQKLKPPPAEGAAAADKPKPPPPTEDPAKLNVPSNWDGRRLACVITTDQPAWNWVYLLNLELAAPREFLDSRVEYNLETQNISAVLSVKRSSRDLIADLAGAPLPIRLKADRDAPEAGIAALLQGPECQLRWSVHADRRVRQFELDVAGYPRAFRYKIVCAEGLEGEEVSPPGPVVRIRSLRSVAKNPMTYVVDPFALGDTAPAADAPPAAAADPAAPPLEKLLVPGSWAAFPADTREVELVVAVDLPLEARENAASVKLPAIDVRLEDTAKATVGRGRLISDGSPEFRLILRENGSLAVAGSLAEHKFLVPVGNAPRAALSLVAELIDEKAGQNENEAPVEDRVPIVVGPRPLDIRFNAGDRSDRSATLTAGSAARLYVTLVSEESTGKPRPNAGIAPKRVALSIKGSDDKLKAIKEEEELTAIEQDNGHWSAKWTVPAQLANQRCTLIATVFDGLGQRSEESIAVFVRSAAGTPAAAPAGPVTKGTIRIKSHVGSTQLKSPKLDELPARQPVVVNVGGQEYWEFRDLDMEQGYTVTADYFHDGTFEVLTSEANVKPSDPKSVRVVPLMPKKKK